MLLLQEFDIEIRDKKSAKNSMDKITPWFPDICNFIIASKFPPEASKFPPEASRLCKEKIETYAKYYIWDDPYLLILYSDQVIRRCISDFEIKLILHFFHSASRGGHYGPTRIAWKVLDFGPPFSETPINLSLPVDNVRKQERPLVEGMKCPSNQFCFVKSLTYALITSKLHSRWNGPFVITNVFPYGAVELKDEVTNSTFQVNGHQLKIFHEGSTPIVGENANFISDRDTRLGQESDSNWSRTRVELTRTWIESVNEGVALLERKSRALLCLQLRVVVWGDAAACRRRLPPAAAICRCRLPLPPPLLPLLPAAVCRCLPHLLSPFYSSASFLPTPTFRTLVGNIV
ncbi:hypothetical protein CR513_28893, partial [Mucuna pruriens]